MNDGALLSDEDWVAVRGWSCFDEAYDYALVALAVGVECGIFSDEAVSEQGATRSHAESEFLIYAPAAQVEKLRFEWQAFEEDCQAASVALKPQKVGRFPARPGAIAAWGVLLLAILYWQTEDPRVTATYCNSSIALVAEGEMWRPFTALFLHADLAHLAGNVLFGGIFILLVCVNFGAWRAWSLILLAGTLGNWLNARLHFPENFSSLGASTATFAALGVLIGHSVRHAWGVKRFSELKALLMPILGGLVMLGWFGSGGGADSNIDVMGHVLGAACGFVGGLIFPVPRHGTVA